MHFATPSEHSSPRVACAVLVLASVTLGLSGFSLVYLILLSRLFLLFDYIAPPLILMSTVGLGTAILEIVGTDLCCKCSCTHGRRAVCLLIAAGCRFLLAGVMVALFFTDPHPLPVVFLVQILASMTLDVILARTLLIAPAISSASTDPSVAMPMGVEVPVTVGVAPVVATAVAVPVTDAAKV